MKRIALISGLIVIAAACWRPLFLGGAPASVTPPHAVEVSSCEVPSDVEKDLPQELYQQRQYFDNYSWRAFAALICDAKDGQRGAFDPAKGRDGKNSRVFETFKSAWEIFHSGTVSPDFASYENKTYNPCGADAAEGDLVLASESKFVDTQEVGEYGLPVGPLLAQNGSHVRYLAQYNRESFDYIVGALKSKPATVDFPNGSVIVKSAWVQMAGIQNPGNFHVRKAWIPVSGNHCQKVDVGLVGLHIIQKTPLRKRWIWSTFEQVNNAPDAGAKCPPPGGPFTFFNSTTCDKIPLTYSEVGQDGKFNVQRAYHFIDSGTTQLMNGGFQGKFAAHSKWRSYELVMTQWPVGDPGPSQAGDPEYTFPTNGTDSAFANTVMETFFQQYVTTSCMACHGKANTDFVWSLEIEPLSSRESGLNHLRQTINAAAARN